MPWTADHWHHQDFLSFHFLWDLAKGNPGRNERVRAESWRMLPCSLLAVLVRLHP